MTDQDSTAESLAQQARFVRERLPSGGLFSGHDWRVSPEPFALGAELAEQLRDLGRLLLQFNRCVNLLYRQSLAGKQPGWVAEWLDRESGGRFSALYSDVGPVRHN